MKAHRKTEKTGTQFTPDEKNIQPGMKPYPDTLSSLDFDDDTDFINAWKGFIPGTELESPIDNNSNPSLKAWDMQAYYDCMGDPQKNPKAAPDEVNKVLWRQEQLNNINGLFRVFPEPVDGKENDHTDGKIYQIRTYDLATMSFIKSDNGWIVIDPLGGNENVAAGLRQFREKVDPGNPIVAVIFSHSHVDHYKGIDAILFENGTPLRIQVIKEIDELATKISYKPGEVAIIAPDGFYDEAISENLYLGNSMQRRAVYMYGSTLPRNKYGHIGSGLGKTVGSATGYLCTPSLEVKMQDGNIIRKLMIDGLNVIFQDAPGTEAPAEYHIYFEKYHTLCPGENVTHTMHNLLTSRGAKVRDPKAFATAIDYSLEQWGDNIQVIAGTHHWPVWGNKNCVDMMEKQRDMYRYFNDQVIRMTNRGMNMEEIAETFRLPQSLDKEFYNRGYYGTINHNVKAVFQRYTGWWDGNPANYFRLPEQEEAGLFVEWMGGIDAMIAKARAYLSDENKNYPGHSLQKKYRWIAHIMKYAVFYDPDHLQARYLQADAFEQLAYTFESGTWRNIFLSGAAELRGKPMVPGIPSGMTSREAFIYQKTEELKTMSLNYILDFFSILVKGEEAGKRDQPLYFSLFVKETEPCVNITLRNGVLYYKEKNSVEADYTFSSINELAEDYKSYMLYLIDNNRKKPEGYDKLHQLYNYFDIFDMHWNIVFPL